MKSNTILCLWLTIVAITATVEVVRACDGGCPVVVNYASGLFPNYQKNFIGLRTRFNSFSSAEGHTDLNISGETTENLYAIDLQARYYPHRRVQLMTFVPLQYNHMTVGNTQQSLMGIGDVALLGFYNVYNSNFLDSSKTTHVKHNLLLGGGIKAPTGAFNAKDEQDVLLSPTFQMGTGAWSFIMSGVYSWRHEKWGFNANATYQINLANPNGYQMGNQLSGRLTGFGVFELKKWTIVPQIGVQAENTANNFNNEFRRIYSGGSQLLSIIGLDFYYKKLQIGLSYEQPLWQEIAGGQMHNHARFALNLNYLF